MNTNDLAASILKYIGGRENIESYVHCATRLRFTLKDADKAQDLEIENLVGVVSVVKGRGQYQVVIGPHVNEVFQALNKLVPTDSKSEQKEKKKLLDRIMGFISGAFSPVLPVITAGGMIQVVLTILVSFNVITDTSDFYLVFYNISQAAFFFIPIYLGFSAAKKLDVDPFLGAMLAGALVLPDMTTLIAREGGVSLFGLQLQSITYSSSVVPILLGVFFMSYVSRIANKFVPSSLKFVVVPMVTILLSAPVTFLILGPLGFTIGEYLAVALNYLSTNLGWASVMVMGALSPILVMGGMHYALFPMLLTNLATKGYDFLIVPGMLAANMGQAGAAFAVYLKTKDSKTKQISLSSSITALMGITEPALYGVNLPLKKPLIGAIIGGAAGGLVAGIGGLQSYALISSVAALPSYLTSTHNFVVAILTVVVAFIVSFIATMLMSFDKPSKTQDSQTNNQIDHNNESNHQNVHSLKLKRISEGTLMPLTEVNDPTFASLALGKGYAITPQEQMIQSPITGKITALFPTGHAIGITSKEGVEVLVHIGIDTVQLGGEHFKPLVEIEQDISEGDLLVEVDLEAIKEKGYDTTTVVVVTNTSTLLDVIPNESDEYPVTVIV